MSNFSSFSKKEPFSNQDHREEEKSHYQRPEFILIDDRQGKSQSTYFGADDSSHQSNESFQQEDSKVKKHSISLRFICLLGLIFCLVFGLGILIWSIVMTFLATLYFFQNQSLNQGVRSFWKICTNTVIAGFGFALGLISPTLGLGLIALYFSITGELVEDELLRKVIRRSFNRI